MKRTRPWFEEWFNSKYYHILYGHRNQNEAKQFIDNLITYLNPQPDAEFLDLACGKGRHALEMANHGYKTVGIDLSKNSIVEASKLEHDSLTFHVGDMRDVHFPNRFTHVFNLFTSFGYFETSEGQKKALDAVFRQLKPGGIFVLDYFNASKVEAHIEAKPNYKVEREDLTFHIKKRVSSCFISKEIQFTDSGRDFTFYEHVWRLGLNDFTALLEKSGFAVQTFYGDYELNKFSEPTSDRLIIVARKP